MRKIFFVIGLFSILGFSCTEKKTQTTVKVNTQQVEVKDTVKTYPLPKNYEQVGAIKTNTVTYKGFQMGDLAHWDFRDENGVVIDINEIADKSHDYKFVVDALPGEESEGGYKVNPELIDKKFHIVWRALHLTHEPKDGMEMYYQNYNQVVEIEQVN